MKKPLVLIVSTLLAPPLLTQAIAEPKPTGVVEKKQGIKPTADWHLDKECQAVFFTVIEGLYRDGISQEVVDLVIGHAEANKVDRAFVFRCPLCHACFEAFALYQRRPTFNGTAGRNTIGNRVISEEVMAGLRARNPRVFGVAFATIVQPWIKADLTERLANGEDGLELMKKYVKLAEEGNKLKTAYTRCQACDAIVDIAKGIEKQKKKEKDSKAR